MVDVATTEREELLERVGPERREIFRLVRQILDDFDTAAPWSLLYNPPDQDDELFALEDALLNSVESIPQIIDSFFDSLRAGCDQATKQSLEDAEFYLRGIHDMTASEVRRLAGKLDKVRAESEVETLTPSTRAYLCELAADLKGKYTSALMGATSAVLAEGIGDFLEVQPVLFEEKAEEFERNEDLKEQLEMLIQSFRDLEKDGTVADIFDRWRNRSRIDLYAFADLNSLRARIMQLLKVRHRRALYSGDYHQIKNRERQFGRRLAEIEQLHRRTWDPDTKAPDEVFRGLGRLMLEILALLDVKLLESVVGEEAIKDLRALATAATHDEDPAATQERVARSNLAPQFHSLVPLFHGEDLKLFSEVLHSAVCQRASLRETAAQQVFASPDESVELPVVEEAPASAPEVPQVTLEPESGAVVTGDDELRNRLQMVLQEVDPSWRRIQMLQRLLRRQYQVPRAMFAQATPSIQELRDRLVPVLPALETAGMVTTGAACAFQISCDELYCPTAENLDMNSIASRLEEIESVMQELTSVLADDLMRLLS